MKQQDKKKMRSLYEEWLGCGESRSGFAKRHGIASNTFNYWVKKFHHVPLVKKSSNFNQLSLEAPLHVNTSPLTAVIYYPSGAKIELYNRAEASFLKELVF